MGSGGFSKNELFKGIILVCAVITIIAPILNFVTIGIIFAATWFIVVIIDYPNIVKTDIPDDDLVTEEFKIYRQDELLHAKSALLAEGKLCLWGEEGCGKSLLANVLVKQLRDEGYLVALVEAASTKQMMLSIADQYGISIYSINGKKLLLDSLKMLISDFMKKNPCILIVDDAHICRPDFRQWLKYAKKRGGCNLLLLATNPPLSDIFLSVARIKLKPMSNKAIREIMIQSARQRGLSLKNHDLSRLQSRSGGNPTLAIRAIEEEFLGVDQEAADHRRIIDITPLIMFVGTLFIVVKFIGLATSDSSMYILGGIGGALFMGLSRWIYSLPKEGNKIN